MTDQNELDRLLQKDWRENVIPQLGNKPNDPWVTVYRDEKNEGNSSLFLYSGIVPNEHIQALLNSTDWEFHASDPVASFTGMYNRESGEDSATYYRYGPNNYDIEPLILVRHFAGLRAKQTELVEEFRLYHNL